MCKSRDYTKSYESMSMYEQKLIDESRKGKSRDRHSVIFLKDKTMAVIAPYDMPLFRTVRTVQNMINRWSPDKVQAISMPRMVA